MSPVNKLTFSKAGAGPRATQNALRAGLLDTGLASDNGLMDSNETPGPSNGVPSPQPPPSFSSRMALLWGDGLGKAAVRSIQVLAVGALAWAAIIAATRIPLVTTPVLIALILASAMAPVVRWLAGHGWPRALAVLSSFLVILAASAGIIGGIVTLVRQQAGALAVRAEAGIAELQKSITTGPLPFSKDQISAAQSEFQKFLSGGSLGADALTGLRTAGEIAAGTVLTAVILFFFLKDGEKIRTFLIGFLPAGRHGTAHLAAERSILVLGSYVRGTLIIAAIDAVMVLIGLLILQVPLAVPLAAVVFLGGFVPIIGATAAGSLAVLVALVENGPVPALVVLIILVVANQFEHHVLQPIFMGRVLRIHGLVIILALAAGATLAGVIGALLAVPLTAVGWTIYRTLATNRPTS
jgi:putative heme transporter